jgi:hypothetical protein
LNSYFKLSDLIDYEYFIARKTLFTYKIQSITFYSLKSGLSDLLLRRYMIFKAVYAISFVPRKTLQFSRIIYKAHFKNRRKAPKYNIRGYLSLLKIYLVFKNNYLVYLFYNSARSAIWMNASRFAHISSFFKKSSRRYLIVYKKIFGEGLLYLRGLFIIFFIDACVTDDEPLWEPIEWSLAQTWILFIFIFAWIAENLITSRFGSFTGRDKRVWFGWYKSFWLIEVAYIISYALAALFVIVPFYYELTYSVSFIFSWWNWYTRVFFFKFICLYSIVITLSSLLQLNLRWLNWKKVMLLIILINFFFAYLLYTHFIMSFFGYFTDPIWYQKSRFVDYVQLSHEPLKWGWGPAKRDHFTYHKVSTVFWFKNDGPFAGAFLMFHLFFFLSIFFVYIYWLVLLRRVYTTKEITATFTTFCVSALKQFYYFFFLLYILIFMSFIVCYWRFPIEFLWMVNSYSWFLNFLNILISYPSFLFSLI